jgi:hypothetical protein
MTSIVSVSAGAFVKSIQSSNTGGVYLDYTRDLFRYQLLYDNVITQLNKYLVYFSKGNFASLVNEFTPTTYKGVILQADSANYYTDAINSLTDYNYNQYTFNNTRQSIYNVVDGLEQSISLVQQNSDLQLKNDTLQTYYEILTDPVKLNDYINKQKINVMPFQASETFNTQIILKPWYSEYLRLYGAPGNGVFQSELLTQIVIDMIQAGTITEQEFMNS